ncbi:MAG: imidazoleglycerol-phosphate dehydratase HisB [Clostridia bacterium]
MREAYIVRKTKETEVQLNLNLDGTGKYESKMPCGFLDHMLNLFVVHSGIDLILEASGDTYVDFHHLVEDIAIVLGMAFKEALGNKAGIRRYGQMLLPMDETLVQVAVDFSGRSYLGYLVADLKERVGAFDTELAEEFFRAFTQNADITLHIDKLQGNNTHHILEAIFKGVARAIKQAIIVEGTEIPSSKGVI